MNDPDLIYKIALGLIPGIGDITARKLVSFAGSPEAVFREPYGRLVRIPGVGETMARAVTDKTSLAKAEKEAGYVTSKGIRVLFYLDDDYPATLKECEDSPVTLYYNGIASLNDPKMLGVVGTRRATSRGRDICESIIGTLASLFPDLVIVSGLAYGIDICAHKAALASGLRTIAVLAHGLGTIYPPAHANTAKLMSGQGGLLTDFVHDAPAERNNFLKRNRIIAGLPRGLLVVESGVKGGALVTAGMAMSYSRDVMAVPGRPSDIWSAGCNRLIKRNIAALVENASDICEVLNWEMPGNPPALQPILFDEPDEAENTVLKAIPPGEEVSADYISLLTGIPVNRLSHLLLSLEIKGMVKCCPGNLYKLAR
ncbi:MAG: DNA-processing protein DprA [Bacteroidales bacterium]|jgi:DNA processing protein|nr:DNA-processing protein DprA [Bacteroidales bacterium]